MHFTSTQEFVSVPNWAHIDIAGVMENTGEVPFLEKGMAGVVITCMSFPYRFKACFGNLQLHSNCKYTQYSDMNQILQNSVYYVVVRLVLYCKYMK